ncbi:MAG TPA: hypothetical protein VI197_29120, partial [Polyangiaceae bacterium]
MTKSTTDTKSPGLPPIRVRRIVWSVVCACAVFVGFVAYAFLAPTIYQTTAEVRLEIPADLENSLHPIADRRHRLTKAVLGPDALKQLSKELALTKPDQRLELAHQLSSGVAISTDDGQLFRIVCTNPSAERTQQLCQGLSRMAAARLPEAAALRNSPEEQARREKLERLLAFLAQHPELSSAQGHGTSIGKDGGQPANDDALLNALTQQRRVVIAELNALQRVDPQNPYADGLKQEVGQAHKRLAALDVALATRRKGLQPDHRQNPGQKLDSKVMDRLTEQLKELTERDPKPVPHAAMKAFVTLHASLPSSPIVPNRTRLLILGALASLGAAILGLGFALAARARPEPTRAASLHAEPSVTPSTAADQRLVTIVPDPIHEFAHAGAFQGGAVHGGFDDGTPAYAPPTDGVAARALPAPQHLGDLPGEGATIEVLEPQDRVKLTTTQVMDGPEPKPVPRTQLGGFELSAPTARDVPELPERASNETPSRADNPLSVKSVIVLEAKAKGEDELDESAPQTLVGGLSAPPEPEPPAPQVKAYTPPKRNITRRLGSLSWLDQAEVSRSPSPPVSTRYSYVSSRPPPP